MIVFVGYTVEASFSGNAVLICNDRRIVNQLKGTENKTNK